MDVTMVDELGGGVEGGGGVGRLEVRMCWAWSSSQRELGVQ